jgi:hypothetical protein
MLFGETVAVYCANHTEHINTLCEYISKTLNVKAGGLYHNQCGEISTFYGRILYM